MRKFTITFIIIILSFAFASCDTNNNIISDRNSENTIISLSSTNASNTTVQTADPIINVENTQQTNDQNELQIAKLNIIDFNITYKDFLINDAVQSMEITKRLGTSQDIYQLISQSTANPSVKRWKLGYPNKSLPEIVLTYLDGINETFLVRIQIFGKDISTNRGIKVGDLIESVTSKYSKPDIINGNSYTYNYQSKSIEFLEDIKTKSITEIRINYNFERSLKEQGAN